MHVRMSETEAAVDTSPTVAQLRICTPHNVTGTFLNMPPKYWFRPWCLYLAQGALVHPILNSSLSPLSDPIPDLTGPIVRFVIIFSQTIPPTTVLRFGTAPIRFCQAVHFTSSARNTRVSPFLS